MKRKDFSNTLSVSVIIILLVAGPIKADESNTDPESYIKRGLADYDNGQYDNAISDYNSAIEIDPKSDLAYYNRDVAYFKKGDYVNSWDDINTAQDLGYPVNPNLLKGLWDVLQSQK